MYDLIKEFREEFIVTVRSLEMSLEDKGRKMTLKGLRMEVSRGKPLVHTIGGAEKGECEPLTK